MRQRQAKSKKILKSKNGAWFTAKTDITEQKIKYYGINSTTSKHERQVLRERHLQTPRNSS